jgi:succinate dehydrogenase / fumarate reductase flavoprotein subunit
MQGLADGYFILPQTIGDYLAPLLGRTPPDTAHPAFKNAERAVADRTNRLLAANGNRSVDSLHRELGKMCWDHCGMSRNAVSLEKALQEIPALRDEYGRGVRVLGENEELNQSLEKAGRVADFMEMAELMCRDALTRDESCGAHFREEHQTPEGEAMRDDDRFAHVSAWAWSGDGQWTEHRELLTFEHVHPTARSYK